MADLFSPEQKTLKLRGKIRYAHQLGKLDYTFSTPQKPEGKWNCVLYPNSDSVAIIREMQDYGLANKLKKDDDGYFMQFSRPEFRTFKGVRKDFSPPIVRRAEGSAITPNTIGNGSDCEIILEIYKWKPPVGSKYNVAARLQEVIVHELIEYTPEKKDEDTQDEW
jgi:hypothetical protein